MGLGGERWGRTSQKTSGGGELLTEVEQLTRWMGDNTWVGSTLDPVPTPKVRPGGVVVGGGRTEGTATWDPPRR